MPTKPENAEAIFLAALEKAAPEERTAFVSEACANDAELLDRVRELLAAHNESHGPLDSPPPGCVAYGGDSLIQERPGTVIGQYKLLEQIGEGGFGVVFM